MKVYETGGEKGMTKFEKGKQHLGLLEERSRHRGRRKKGKKGGKKAP